MIKLKGLSHSNGYFFCQRSVPKDIKDHPVFGGKKLYKKSLGTNLQTEEDIHNAWLEQHKAFESLASNIRKVNLPLLESRKLTEEASNLLKAHGLKVGQRSPNTFLSDYENKNLEDATDLQSLFVFLKMSQEGKCLTW